MSDYKLGLEYAKQQDQKDDLKHYRNLFHIPKDNQGNDWLYFTGNSLGLQPKSTKEYINQELEDWANLGMPSSELIIKTSSFTESRKLSIIGSNGGFALKKMASNPARGNISSLS